MAQRPGPIPATKSAATPSRSAKSGAVSQATPVPVGAHSTTSASVRAPATPSPKQIHSSADRAMSGPASRFPHFDSIQKSFGRHSIGHLRAYTGPQAQTENKRNRSLGMTKGFNSAFRSNSPDPHTSAHEAAHGLIYGISKVNLPGNVGSAGDAHEKMADRIADRVVSGRSAESLIDQVAHGPKARKSGVPNRKK